MILVLLELFEYVSLSDYDLSFDLKDEMSELIGVLTPEVIKVNREKYLTILVQYCWLLLHQMQ